MTASVAAELDARLPGLDELFDDRRAAALFAATWRREVRDCRLLGTRYSPGVECVATYAVVPDAASPTIGVVELQCDGRRVRSYEDDPGLPGLREAADPEAVSSLLSEVVEARRTTVVPVRYRPGQRAVLRYEVDTPSGSVVLFGKVVGAGLAALAAAFAQLHERSRAGSGPFVPAPTAVNERLGLLVLPAVEGRSFHVVAFDRDLALTERADAFRMAGGAVALLHHGPPPTFTPADDVAELSRSAEALRAIDPRLAQRWDDVLAELAAMDVGPVAAVPSHGALRTDQIMLTPDGPGLLDLDGFCAAPPARDVGNMLAYLAWRAVRRPHDAAMCGAGRKSFLDGYGEAPAPIQLAHHEGLSLLKIVARRYRNLDVAEWPLVPDLVETAASLAGSGS